MGEHVRTAEMDLEIEEPNYLADLGLRLLVMAVLVGVIIVVSATAYGSVEDVSGPATAPPTSPSTASPSANQTVPVHRGSPHSTPSLEALVTTTPLRVLTPEELAAVEAETAEETDGDPRAPSGAADERPVVTTPGADTPESTTGTETTTESEPTPAPSTVETQATSTTSADDPQPAEPDTPEPTDATTTVAPTEADDPPSTDE